MGTVSMVNVSASLVVKGQHVKVNVTSLTTTHTRIIAYNYVPLALLLLRGPKFVWIPVLKVPLSLMATSVPIVASTANSVMERVVMSAK
jgi:hypothetical protein